MKRVIFRAKLILESRMFAFDLMKLANFCWKY